MRKKGGDRFKAAMRGLDGDAVTVTDRGDGSYGVRYTAPSEGTFSLAVAGADGCDVGGSPATLTVFRCGSLIEDISSWICFEFGFYLDHSACCLPATVMQYDPPRYQTLRKRVQAPPPSPSSGLSAAKTDVPGDLCDFLHATPAHCPLAAWYVVISKKRQMIELPSAGQM